MDLTEIEKNQEAEHYFMKSLFILQELQANKQVFGSNSILTGAKPANIKLALQYINRSIDLFPNNGIYLNQKALLLWEGSGEKEEVIALLERASELNPRDIDIKNNLITIKSYSNFWIVICSLIGIVIFSILVIYVVT